MRAESLMSFIPHPRAPTIGSDERFSYDNTVTLSHWFHVSLIRSAPFFPSSFRPPDPEPSLARVDLRSFQHGSTAFSTSSPRSLSLSLCLFPPSSSRRRNARAWTFLQPSLDPSSFPRGKSRGKLASKDPPLHVSIEFRDTFRLHPVPLDTIKGRNCSIDGKSRRFIPPSVNNSISKNRWKTEDDGGLKSLRDRRYCEKLEILGILKGGRLSSGDRTTWSFFAGFNFSASRDEVVGELRGSTTMMMSLIIIVEQDGKEDGDE